MTDIRTNDPDFKWRVFQTYMTLRSALRIAPNRFETCCTFARYSAAKTGKNVSVLALPNGQFRAMFTSKAARSALLDTVAATYNGNGERL